MSVERFTQNAKHSDTCKYVYILWFFCQQTVKTLIGSQMQKWPFSSVEVPFVHVMNILAWLINWLISSGDCLKQRRKQQERSARCMHAIFSWLSANRRKMAFWHRHCSVLLLQIRGQHGESYLSVNPCLPPPPPHTHTHKHTPTPSPSGSNLIPCPAE